jgi:hypothetical protein
MPPTVRHRAPDAVHLWMTGSLLKVYGGLSPVGKWWWRRGGSVTSWTRRSGGYGDCLPARGCSTAGWRWWLAAWLRPCLFLCRWAGAGRAAGSSLGYGLVLLPILPLAGRRRFPGAVLVLIVASGLAGAALAPPPFFLGPAILVAVSSVAAYGSQCLSVAGLAVAGRHSGRFFCTVSVAFWPVGGPSCAAGEVQHGEGWPWRQSVAGDPGARTTWCSAC